MPEPTTTVDLVATARDTATSEAERAGCLAVRMEWQPTPDGANYAVAIASPQSIAFAAGCVPLIHSSPSGCLAAAHPGLRPLGEPHATMTELQLTMRVAAELLAIYGERRQASL